VKKTFCPNFSSVTQPLTELLRKNVKFIWTERCQSAFSRLKALLQSAPVLSAPDFSRPFKQAVNPSDIAAGAVLNRFRSRTRTSKTTWIWRQNDVAYPYIGTARHFHVVLQEDDDGIDHPVAYFSRKSNHALTTQLFHSWKRMSCPYPRPSTFWRECFFSWSSYRSIQWSQSTGFHPPNEGQESTFVAMEVDHIGIIQHKHTTHKRTRQLDCWLSFKTMNTLRTRYIEKKVKKRSFFQGGGGGCNLIPRLFPLRASLEERPWSRLVTCLPDFGRWQHFYIRVGG
jgi:hypothetical protein